MGIVIQFTPRDPRILKECLSFFSNSPEFAVYLANRITALGGSQKMAEILCSTLHSQWSTPTVPISAECVFRLSVDTIPGAVGKINKAHPDGPYAIAFRTMVFLMRKSGLIEVPAGSKTIDDLLIRQRPSIRDDHKGEYVKLYCCALAMLAGVKINPREEAA